MAIIRPIVLQLLTRIPKRRGLPIPLAQVPPNVGLVAHGHGRLGRQGEGVDLDGREARQDL